MLSMRAMDTLAPPDDLQTPLISLRPLGGADEAALRALEHGGRLRRVSPADAPRPAGAFAFAVAARDGVVGVAGFAELDRAQGRAMLAATWAVSAWDDALLDRHATFLLLRLGFEMLGCRRVGLHADAGDARGRRLLQHAGFRREGILRCYALGADDGTSRDIAVWSVIRAEWPQVKRTLEAAIAGWPGLDRLPSVMPP